MCFDKKPVVVGIFTGDDIAHPRKTACALCPIFSGTDYKAMSPAGMLPHYTWHHGVAQDFLKITDGGIILNGG